MYTQEEAQFQIAKQSAFGVAGSDGKLIPGEASWNVKQTRNKIENNQVQNDGFKRQSRFGNRISQAGGTIVYNLNLIGIWLAALCDGLTSAAFTGVERVNVTNGGSGYTSAPAVGFTGGIGSGAAGVAVVMGGSVVAVLITNHGTGYTGAPTVSFTGGGGTGAAATAVIDLAKFKHTGKLRIGAPLYYTVEKGIVGGTLFRVYPNMVLRKLSFADAIEGISSVTDDWVGSGKRTKATSSIDSTPTEVTGTPGEFASLLIAENDVANGGVITELSSDFECNVRERRVPDTTAEASELRRGGWMMNASGKAWFESEALANKMQDQTITKIQSTLLSADGVFTRVLPEFKFTSNDEWERSDEGIVIPFEAESIKQASSLAPVEFTLINATASY